MHAITEKKITIKINNQLLIDVLVELTNFSKQTLKMALDKGCVWLKIGAKTKRIRRVKKPLKIGSEVFIYFNEKILASIPTQPTLMLDKQDYSVWLKPAGVFSQGSKWGDHCSLTRLAEKHLNRNSFLVHRLDRATSGVMIIAHTKTLAREFSQLFANRQIEKTYLAIVNGDFPYQTISLNNHIDGKYALSHVTKLIHEDDKSLLKITIETGRKHQIRKHLSVFGYPIIGDRLYSNADKNYPENLQLQALSLVFQCPISQSQIKLSIPKEAHLKIATSFNLADNMTF